MKNILDYLNTAYEPKAIIVYGSYRDGSNNADSDFDCLIISTKTGCRHDTSTVDGVVLDAFIYTPEEVSDEVDCYELLQIHDGLIVKDTDGIAAALRHKVQRYLLDMPRKTPEDIRGSMDWCEKMLRRTERADAEGYFRWHWLLHDSLEIYCDIRGQYYFGPKKSIRFLEESDPGGYKLYTDALARFEHAALRAWISYLRKLVDKEESDERCTRL